jgi:hypothetical protein
MVDVTFSNWGLLPSFAYSCGNKMRSHRINDPGEDLNEQSLQKRNTAKIQDDEKKQGLQVADRVRRRCLIVRVKDRAPQKWQSSSSAAMDFVYVARL